jgi:pSer/pThr/pTyr-binding forkhead associated (FHA) protein
MTVCTICGKENPAGADYCEDCGAALAPATGAPAAVGSAPEEVQGDAAPPAADPPFVPEDGATPAPPDAATPAAAGGTATAPAPVTNPRLAVKRYGAVTTEEIPLQGERLVVGRFDPESGPVDIDLSSLPEAGQLSRHHAELYREADGRWYVKDLGSTNGVFVKRPDSSTFGARITAPAALNPGDEVAFGNARFLFRAD